MRKLLFVWILSQPPALGCGGDPGQQFVGLYVVRGTITYDNTLAPIPIYETAFVSESATTHQLLFSDYFCNIGATASKHYFTLEPLSCPSKTVIDPVCNECTITMTYTGGTGSLQEGILIVSAAGTYTATCTGCPGTLTGNFNENLSG